MVLARHGESVANAAGVFTGWLDVSLTARGRVEAGHLGRTLVGAGIIPEVVYTSTLARCSETAASVVGEIGRVGGGVTIEHRRDLDERHYGSLTGRSKSQVHAEVGDTLFGEFRNSLSTPPPPLTAVDLARLTRDRWPCDRLSILGVLSESLGDVVVRARRVWEHELRPDLEASRTVVVVGHGNSLRALMVTIDTLDQTELSRRRVATGVPLVYDFDADMRPVVRGGRLIGGAEHAGDRGVVL